MNWRIPRGLGVLPSNLEKKSFMNILVLLEDTQYEVGTGTNVFRMLR